MEQFNPEKLLSTLNGYTQSMGPLEWGIIGGGIALILLLAASISSTKRRRKRNAQKVAPSLSLDTFQISPLGRDAYFKVLNNGQPARLSNMAIKGRKDVVVKNAVAGHELQSGESYRILLEATGTQKLNADFTIELSYVDLVGNVYQQAFALNQQAARQPKLVRLA
ncbi:MAG: hypothetical protein H6573_00685 [Lewinellaceae bacterium]|nr:hypothetical protein [Phaeodactylibacter sp.]MCB0614396.1 hypothetical protein [Phaeodactylibacter sp.]MCB9346014.1 hypothetical protein [Lewinellaceae bacterium]